MRLEIEISALSIEWKRAIHRVLFFANEHSLTEKILRKVEKSLLLYSQQAGIPLVTIGKSGSLRFLNQEFTIEEFVDCIDEHKPFEGFVLLIKPKAFCQNSVAKSARCIWVRSRPLGIPAFAVCDAGANPLWREFAADAFTRFYLFNMDQKLSPELLVQSDYIKSFVVELDHNMVAVCQEKAL